MSSIFVLGRSAGFYSQYFFLVQKYLLCKRENTGFHVDSSQWLFKSKEGWVDYFQEIADLPVPEGGDNSVHYFSHTHFFYSDNHLFNMYQYREAILGKLYLYNDTVKRNIQETNDRLGLIKGEYGAIFIRRGDKLLNESEFIPSESYMETLLHKYPECRTVFLQTDDYQCFLDIQSYIQSHGLDIRLLTLCDPSLKGGMVIVRNEEHTRQGTFLGNQQHVDYFNQIIGHLASVKPVDEMDPDEIYQHTMDMIVGVDIVLHSHTAILDNQSNVSRFISIIHDHLDRVSDVRCPDVLFDMNRTLCPAFQC